MQGYRSEFSSQEIDKNVLKSTLEHPSVLIPSAVGGLGLAAVVLLEPSLWFMLAAGIGATLGALSWGANFSLRRDYFAKQYVEQVAREIEGRRVAATQALRQLLGEVESVQGQAQFTRSTDKFNALKAMLDRKLNPGELTYSRYIGIAEQVYLAILDNLTDVANVMRSLQVIDEGYVNGLLKNYEGSEPDSDAGKAQGALKKRLALLDAQEAKMQRLLAQNEEAMTQLDFTIASIADLKTGEQQATMDIESAMAELGRLAGRIGEYER